MRTLFCPQETLICFQETLSSCCQERLNFIRKRWFFRRRKDEICGRCTVCVIVSNTLITCAASTRSAPRRTRHQKWILRKKRSAEIKRFENLRGKENVGANQKQMSANLLWLRIQLDSTGYSELFFAMKFQQILQIEMLD